MESLISVLLLVMKREFLVRTLKCSLRNDVNLGQAWDKLKSFKSDLPIFFLLL